MRIVYDDEMQNILVNAVEKFMNNLDIASIVSYEWGSDRVQMSTVKKKLNDYLKTFYYMEIGNKVTHAHGIGNNCNYPVYFYPEGEQEIQHCANINLNSGCFGEGFISIEDYNGNKVGASYELHKSGIKKKEINEVTAVKRKSR